MFEDDHRAAGGEAACSRPRVEDGPVHAYLFHGPAGRRQADRRRSRSRRRCSATAAVSSAGRTPTSTCSSRSATRFASTRSGGSVATSTCGRSRPIAVSTSLVSAHSLNDEAADALLKDLEEPPPYAVPDPAGQRAGPLPETIRSRCQLVPFSRLSEKAVHDLARRAGARVARGRITALARVAGGRLDRAERLLDDDATARREELLALARGVYADASFEPSTAAASIVRMADTVAKTARAAAEEEVEWLDLPDREREQRLRRAEFGADARERARGARGAGRRGPRPRRRGEVGAEGVVTHFDHLAELTRGRQHRAAAQRRASRRDRARRGAGSRSSTSSPGLRWKRSSCGSEASWLKPDRPRYPWVAPT